QRWLSDARFDFVSDTPESTRDADGPPASSAGQACPGLSRAIAWDDPACLRGDICTAEHLEEHAIAIARAQGAPSRDVLPGPLRERFTAARDRINNAYRILERGAPTRR